MKKTLPKFAEPRRPPYTVKRAALFLGVSVDTVRRLVKKRVLRASRIVKGTTLIPASDVENLVESTCY